MDAFLAWLSGAKQTQNGLNRLVTMQMGCSETHMALNFTLNRFNVMALWQGGHFGLQIQTIWDIAPF